MDYEEDDYRPRRRRRKRRSDERPFRIDTRDQETKDLALRNVQRGTSGNIIGGEDAVTGRDVSINDPDTQRDPERARQGAPPRREELSLRRPEEYRQGMQDRREAGIEPEPRPRLRDQRQERNLATDERDSVQEADAAVDKTVERNRVAREKAELRYLKDQGVETRIDETGTEVVDRHEDGSPKFKPEVIDDARQMEDGTYKRIIRNDYGQEQVVEPSSSVDRSTGMRYITKTDPSTGQKSRIDIGPDEWTTQQLEYRQQLSDLSLQTAELSLQNTQQRAELSKLESQRRTVEKPDWLQEWTKLEKARQDGELGGVMADPEKRNRYITLREAENTRQRQLADFDAKAAELSGRIEAADQQLYKYRSQSVNLRKVKAQHQATKHGGAVFDTSADYDLDPETQDLIAQDFADAELTLRERTEAARSILESPDTPETERRNITSQLSAVQSAMDLTAARETEKAATGGQLYPLEAIAGGSVDPDAVLSRVDARVGYVNGDEPVPQVTHQQGKIHELAALKAEGVKAVGQTPIDDVISMEQAALDMERKRFTRELPPDEPLLAQEQYYGLSPWQTGVYGVERNAEGNLVTKPIVTLDAAADVPPMTLSQGAKDWLHERLDLGNQQAEEHAAADWAMNWRAIPIGELPAALAQDKGLMAKAGKALAGKDNPFRAELENRLSGYKEEAKPDDLRAMAAVDIAIQEGLLPADMGEKLGPYLRNNMRNKMAERLSKANPLPAADDGAPRGDYEGIGIELLKNFDTRAAQFLQGFNQLPAYALVVAGEILGNDVLENTGYYMASDTKLGWNTVHKEYTDGEGWLGDLNQYTGATMQGLGQQLPLMAVTMGASASATALGATVRGGALSAGAGGVLTKISPGLANLMATQIEREAVKQGISKSQYLFRAVGGTLAGSGTGIVLNAGGNMHSAKMRGMSEEDKIAYGLLGATLGPTEMLGISSMVGRINRMSGGAATKVFQKLARPYMVEMLEEGTQEAFTTAVNLAFEDYALGRKNEDAGKQIFQDFVVGAAVASLMGVGVNLTRTRNTGAIVSSADARGYLQADLDYTGLQAAVQSPEALADFNAKREGVGLSALTDAQARDYLNKAELVRTRKAAELVRVTPEAARAASAPIKSAGADVLDALATDPGYSEAAAGLGGARLGGVDAVYGAQGAAVKQSLRSEHGMTEAQADITMARLAGAQLIDDAVAVARGQGNSVSPERAQVLTDAGVLLPDGKVNVEATLLFPPTIRREIDAAPDTFPGIGQPPAGTIDIANQIRSAGQLGLREAANTIRNEVDAKARQAELEIFEKIRTTGKGGTSNQRKAVKQAVRQATQAPQTVSLKAYQTAMGLAPDAARSQHATAVEAALRRGEAVRADILADHPELKAKAGDLVGAAWDKQAGQALGKSMMASRGGDLMRALGVAVVQDKDASGFGVGADGLATGWIKAGTNNKGAPVVHVSRAALAQVLGKGNFTEAEAQQYVADSLAEEVTHAAGVEAVARIAEERGVEPAVVEREIHDSMPTEHWENVAEIYGRPLTAREAVHEYLRQVVQLRQGGSITENTTLDKKTAKAAVSYLKATMRQPTAPVRAWWQKVLDLLRGRAPAASDIARRAVETMEQILAEAKPIQARPIPAPAPAPVPAVESTPATQEAAPEPVPQPPAPDPVVAQVAPAAAPDAAPVDTAAAQADPNPTEAQKEAGNYRMGHEVVDGLGITIETAAGRMRHGKSQQGKKWSVRMKAHYGYIKRTEGPDGDQVDVFVKPGTTKIKKVFIIDQVDPEIGGFDEHKVMLGYDTQRDAREAYLANYAKDWKGLGNITTMNLGQFKAWLKDGDTTKPVGVPRKKQRGFSVPYQPMGGPDIIDQILHDIGGILPKGKAQKLRGGEWWEQNSSLYDDMPVLPGVYNQIMQGEERPDQVAAALGMDVPEMWDSIRRAIEGRQSIAGQIRQQQEEWTKAEAEAKAQDKAWDRDAFAKDRGEIALPVAGLAVGDSVTVEWETLSVIAVDPDTYAVTLQDGTKYGLQQVEAGQVIYAEDVEQYVDESTIPPEIANEPFLTEEDMAPEVSAPAPDAPARRKVYIRGNYSEYTGKTEEYAGGIIYEVIPLEGPKKGESQWTNHAPPEADHRRIEDEPQLFGSPPQRKNRINTDQRDFLNESGEEDLNLRSETVEQAETFDERTARERAQREADEAQGELFAPVRITPELAEQYQVAVGNLNRPMALRVLREAAGVRLKDWSLDRGDGVHTPPAPDDGAPGYDVSDNDIYPEDVYSFQGLRYYGTGEDGMDATAWGHIQQMHGKPQAQVRIYRAVEKEAEGGSKAKIQPGDWVTTVRAYAVDHGRTNLSGKPYRIISKTVSARDIFTNGDSWLEWGYHPQAAPLRPFRRESPGEGEVALPMAERPILPLSERQGELESYRKRADDWLAAPVPQLHHGTPHVIEGGFSLSKIGTGEGNQTFGWGLYFAQEPRVAARYRKRLSLVALLEKMADVYGTDYYDWDGTLDYNPVFNKAEWDFLTYLSSEDWLGFDAPWQAVKAAINEPSAYDIDPAKLPPLGNLYSVNLQADTDDLLNWDVSLGQQPQRIQDAFRTLADKSKQSLHFPPEMSGEEAYWELAEYAGGKKEASETLAEFGIPGMRFLDAKHRPLARDLREAERKIEQAKEGIQFRKDESLPLDYWQNRLKQAQDAKAKLEQVIEDEATRNFVVWDDSKIAITHHNGGPVSMGSAMELQAPVRQARFLNEKARRIEEVLTNSAVSPAWAGLAPEERQIMQSIIRGDTAEQVSTAMNLPADAVRQTYKRVLQDLREAGDLAQRDARAFTRFSRNPAGQAPARSAAAETALRKGLGTLAEHRGYIARLRQWWFANFSPDALIQAGLDRFYAINSLEKRTYGPAWDVAEASAYEGAIDAIMYRGPTRLWIEGRSDRGGGQMQWVNGKLEAIAGTRGLMEILEPVMNADGGDQLRNFEGYLLAVRADRLETEGRENNLTRADIDELLQYATATVEVPAGFFPARPDVTTATFEELRQEYSLWNQRLLDMQEGAGLISAADRAVWENADYVPFWRLRTELEGTALDPIDGDQAGAGRNTSGAQGAPGNGGRLSDQDARIHRLRGGLGAVPIMENIVKNLTHATEASLRNMAMRRIYAMATPANLDILEPVNYDMRVQRQQAGEAIDNLEQTIGRTLSGLSLAEREMLVQTFRAIPPRGSGIVSLMVDGQRRYLKVKDPLLLRSIEGLGQLEWTGAFGQVMRVARTAKTILTHGVTLAGGFMVANPMRDTLSAAATAGTDFVPVLDTFRGAIHAMRQDADYWAIVGGGASFAGYYDYSDAAIRRTLYKLNRGNRRSLNPGAVVMNLWQAWNHLGEISEASTRIGIYNKVRAAGGSHAAGIAQARGIMNFAMTGDSSGVRFFLATVPFLNARLQGLYRLSKSVRATGLAAAGQGANLTPAEQRMARNLSTYGAGIMIGSLMLYLWNRLNQPEYDDLEEWDKDTYWHLWVGGQHIRIPKPFEVGAIFGTLPERLTEYTFSTGDEKLLMSRVWEMLTQTLAMDLRPQVALPLMEVMENRDSFTGRQIIDQNEEFLDPRLRADAYTSQTAAALARVMPAGEYLQSPKQLQHLIEGYFGTLGSFALTSADVIGQMSGLYGRRGEAPAARAKDYPVAGRFLRGDSPATTKYVEAYYQVYNEVEGLYRSVREASERGDNELIGSLTASDIAKARLMGSTFAGGEAEAGGYVALVRKAKRELASLGKEAKAIRENANLSADEKRRLLDQITMERNAIAETAVKADPRHKEQVPPIPFFQE